MTLALRETLTHTLGGLTREVRELAVKPDTEDSAYDKVTQKYVEELEHKVELRLRQEREDIKAEKREKEARLSLEKKNLGAVRQLEYYKNYRLLVLTEEQSLLPIEEVKCKTREIISLNGGFTGNSDQYDYMKVMLSYIVQQVPEAEKIQLRVLPPHRDVDSEFYFYGWSSARDDEFAKYRTTYCMIVPHSLAELGRFLTVNCKWACLWETFVLEYLYAAGTVAMDTVLDILAIHPSYEKKVVPLRQVAQALRFKSIPRRKLLQLISEGVLTSELLQNILNVVFREEFKELRQLKEEMAAEIAEAASDAMKVDPSSSSSEGSADSDENNSSSSCEDVGEKSPEPTAQETTEKADPLFCDVPIRPQ